MSLNAILPDSLVRIAAAGGGLTISARGVLVDTLVRIASAASKSGARITIEESQVLLPDSMVRIAAAGKGTVSFE